jgi:hypothetical protein
LLHFLCFLVWWVFLALFFLLFSLLLGFRVLLFLGSVAFWKKSSSLFFLRKLMAALPLDEVLNFS